MAKMITYLAMGEAARNYNLSKDTVQHFLHQGLFQGAFQGENGVWNIPEPEAERVLAKFKGCMRAKLAAKEVGMDQTTLSGWIRRKQVVAYKPVVGSNGKTGATYVDMVSLRNAIAARKVVSAPVPDPMPAVRSVTPVVRSTPSVSATADLMVDITLLRASIETLAGSVSALAQAVTVQGSNTNELYRQVKHLSDWLGEIAIQKAQ